MLNYLDEQPTLDRAQQARASPHQRPSLIGDTGVVVSGCLTQPHRYPYAPMSSPPIDAVSHALPADGNLDPTGDRHSLVASVQLLSRNGQAGPIVGRRRITYESPLDDDRTGAQPTRNPALVPAP